MREITEDLEKLLDGFDLALNDLRTNIQNINMEIDTIKIRLSLTEIKKPEPITNMMHCVDCDKLQVVKQDGSCSTCGSKSVFKKVVS